MISKYRSYRKNNLVIELTKTKDRLKLKEDGINELNKTIIQLMVANNQMIGIKFSSCPICFNHVSLVWIKREAIDGFIPVTTLAIEKLILILDPSNS